MTGHHIAEMDVLNFLLLLKRHPSGKSHQRTQIKTLLEFDIAIVQQKFKQSYAQAQSSIQDASILRKAANSELAHMRPQM